LKTLDSDYPLRVAEDIDLRYLTPFPNSSPTVGPQLLCQSHICIHNHISLSSPKRECAVAQQLNKDVGSETTAPTIKTGWEHT